MAGNQPYEPSVSAVGARRSWEGDRAARIRREPPANSPTVILPTSRVPAMDAFTTGMCSESSDSKTLHPGPQMVRLMANFLY